GSQGSIEMIAGVDADKAVRGVSIVRNTETAGIGSKVMDNNALPSGVGVLDQFIGKSGAGTLTVGKTVDAISGATVSSKGVTKGVNGALAVADTLDWPA
ncbi:MAG: FMN-binding protein, partial [Oscillospiraceae bacterium]|nr:FMN-binding protein [Oscillospiraceae bacterium]